MWRVIRTKLASPRRALSLRSRGVRKFEVPLIKGGFRGIVYVLLGKRVAFCKDAVVEGREDEIGLAKASPFSFLPEASLQKSQTNDYLRGSHRESFFCFRASAYASIASPKTKKASANAEAVQIIRLPFCGEDEIRTRGTLIRYVGLANRWFQPLTHLSVAFVDRFYPKGCANIGCFLE